MSRDLLLLTTSRLRRRGGGCGGGLFLLRFRLRLLGLFRFNGLLLCSRLRGESGQLQNTKQTGK